jgi:hypothetical protein
MPLGGRRWPGDHLGGRGRAIAGVRDNGRPRTLSWCVGRGNYSNKSGRFRRKRDAVPRASPTCHASLDVPRPVGLPTSLANRWWRTAPSRG